MSFARTLTRFCIASFLFGVVFSAQSCGSGETDTDMPVDTMKYTATSDTLAYLFGQVSGRRMAYQLRQFQQIEDSTYSMDNFIEGLEVIYDRRHSQAFISGAGMGLQIGQDLNSIQEAGYKINREKVLDDISSQLLENKNDSLNINDLQSMIQQYTDLTTRLFETKPDENNSSLLDSIQNVYADLVAQSVMQDLETYKSQNDKTYDIKSFVKGIRAVAGELHSPEFLAGVNNAVMLSANQTAIEKKGVFIRPEDVLKSIKEAFALKNIDANETGQLLNQFNEIVERIDKARYEAEDKELAKSDEAIQNKITGDALIEKARKENPEAKTTESGLTYIITQPGTGKNISVNDTVIVTYSATHLDGKLFDMNKEIPMVPAAVIDGMKEGFQLLNKGSKATFWVPGNLGYGGHGVPSAGVGPLEAIIFNVEIIDIKPAQQ